MGVREKDVSFFWVEESNGQLSSPPGRRKRKARQKKMTFSGWGSAPLIDFLESIGRDTSKKLSQHEVTAIINEYVHQNNLLHPGKKKRILCDERLHGIFGRKSVARIKIYDFLEEHFTENQDGSEDELYSSEGKDEDVMTAYRESKVICPESTTPRQKKNMLEDPKSCFAAINAENMKLLYLKRSLVQDLLRDPENFEHKVVGSYVRIKPDPNDNFQKSSHQLQEVIGARKASQSCNVDDEILLQVSNLIKDIPICKLSDDNFSEEECEDLCQRVKAGLMKKHTVVEFQRKAEILHADITKHWLVRELSLLQNLIDRANEKGWRRELFEYLERKQLLQTPSEQSRLLHEVPKVIADKPELEAKPKDLVEDMEPGNNHSPKSTLRGASDVSTNDSEANQTLTTNSSGSTNTAGPEEAVIPSQAIHLGSSISNVGSINFIHETREADDHASGIFQPKERPHQSSGVTQPGSLQESSIPRAIAGEVKATQVIDLSDDDQEIEAPGAKNLLIGNSPEILMWHYMDPQGDVQGPFSLMALKRWSDLDYFEPGFKVWKTGQKPKDAVLLSETLARMSPS